MKESAVFNTSGVGKGEDNLHKYKPNLPVTDVEKPPGLGGVSVLVSEEPNALVPDNTEISTKLIWRVSFR